MRETTSSGTKLSEPPSSNHDGRTDKAPSDRYDTWHDLCQVRDTRLKLSETRKRRSRPAARSGTMSDSESESEKYEPLLSIEVDIKRRMVSEQDEAAALSFLLTPDTTFPIKRPGRLDGSPDAGKEHALDMLAAMNLITVDEATGDVQSVSDSARALARQLGCVHQSMVVKATELSADLDAEELASFPSVMEIEKKKVRIN